MLLTGSLSIMLIANQLIQAPEQSFLSHLNDRDVDVRKAAVWAILHGKTFRSPATVVALIRALQDESLCVRRYATIALGFLGEHFGGAVVLTRKCLCAR